MMITVVFEEVGLNLVVVEGRCGDGGQQQISEIDVWSWIICKKEKVQDEKERGRELNHGEPLRLPVDICAF